MNIRSSLRRNWFLLGLVLVVVIGFAFSRELQILPQISALRIGIVVCVLFLMSFPLAIGDLRRSIQRPLPALLASTINFGLLPLVAWGASLLSTGDLALGINIMAAIPCTLASAAVWTRRAGGNDATALIVTLLTNSLCFCITPFWLYWTTGSAIQISIFPQSASGMSMVEMMTKLFLLVVLPMAAGQLLRLPRGFGAWASRHKPQLGRVAQVGILSMVLLGSISSGLKLRTLPSDQMPQLISFATMILLVVAVHGIAAWAGLAASRGLGLPREEEIAVVLAGSQKTLMIGLAIVTEFYPASPLAILPMVAFHVGQLFIDTAIADKYLAAKVARINAEERNQTP